ncbi:hypothetical protein V8E51_000230 [Hyaloscypha variabilis]
MAETSEQQAGKPIKYTITHHRQPKHTHEAFIKWIVEDHIPAAMPFLSPPPLNAVVAQQFSNFRPTWDFADYDCVIEYILPSLETITNVLSDPEWAEVLKDQDEWVDTSRALVSVGHFTPYLLESGEVVNVKK